MDQQQAPEATHHLLEVKNTQNEGFNDTAQEFLEQNVVVSREIYKYDKKLSAWPIVILKIWLGLHIFHAIIGSIAIFQATLEGKIELSIVELIILYINLVGIWISAGGCLLVFSALWSKLIQRIERAILIFKIAMCISVFALILSIVTSWSTEASKDLSFLHLAIMIHNGILILPSFYVRNVLIKRKILHDVSSFTKD